jgi:protein SCO1/2
MSSKSGSGVQRGLWGVLFAVMALIAVAFLKERSGPKDWVSPLSVYSKVQPFSLTNQQGAPFTLDRMKGKVWVADIIFTRCPGPCAAMTRTMGALQGKLAGREGVEFVSLTTDPDYDTPEILARFAEGFDADLRTWHFLTGSKPEIARIAIDSLKLTSMEKPSEYKENEFDLFIHSTVFVLVDKMGQVRGVYESAEPEFMGKILPDIESLLNESYLSP